MSDLPSNIKQVTSEAQAENPSYRSVAFAPSILDEVRSNGAPSYCRAEVRQYNEGVILPKPLKPEEISDLQEKKHDDGFVWTVSQRNLRPVPPHFPVERTQCSIPTTITSVHQIADRVSNACQKMSISAQYTDSSAFLLSSDHVDFRVNLFSSQDYQETIVEVQRQRGNCLSFFRYAKKILSAAQGNEDIDFDEPMPCVGPVTEKLREAVKEGIAKERANSIRAIEIAGNLLSKDRIDAKMLGLESLCLLTDHNKTGYLTAKLTSRAILCNSLKEGSEDEERMEEELLVENLDIRSQILYLIDAVESDLDEHTDGNQEILFDHSIGEHTVYHQGFNDILHNLALAVLSNALACVSSEGELEGTIEEQSWLNGSQLVSRLVDVLRQASKRPHDAVLSARCLGFLVQASQEASDRVLKCGALKVVADAKRYGDRQHQKLAEESQSLHARLEETCR